MNMREILFRGKRIDSGEWVYGDFTRYSEHMSYIDVDLIENEVYKVLTETVGQFTGLNDKNGVRIFEGDIVDILCEDGETGVIKWDIETARFVVLAEGFEADFDNYYGKDLAVIGAIHDTPFLVGG